MPRDLAFIGGISSSVITIRTSVMMVFFLAFWAKVKNAATTG